MLAVIDTHYERGFITMAFIDKIKERAKADKKTIVLPESMDKRTYEAAEENSERGYRKSDHHRYSGEIEKNGKGFDISGATIVDPYNDPNKQKYIDKFVELRGEKRCYSGSRKRADGERLYVLCLPDVQVRRC